MRTSTFSPTDHLSDATRVFLARRTAEIAGLALITGLVVVGLALATWSVTDPSWNHASGGPVHNIIGPVGAIVADIVMQLCGIAVIAVLMPLICAGWQLLTRRRIEHARLRLTLLLVGTAAAAALASLLPITDRWPLPTGLGGLLGDAMLIVPRRLCGHATAALIALAGAFAVTAIMTLTAAAGFGLRPMGPDDDGAMRDWADMPAPRSGDEDRAGDPGVALVSIGVIVQGLLTIGAAVSRLCARTRSPEASERIDRSTIEVPGEAPPIRIEPRYATRDRIEPVFGSLQLTPDRAAVASPIPVESEQAVTPVRPSRGYRPRRVGEQDATYELPRLGILAEARAPSGHRIPEDALAQNARLLEGVLEDFGIRGEIINVRPGPVVTLYELEPAPGIKSSRVVGLADDIARSMSAVSARVAVVQGRNAIGIELPNQRRDTVYLRELLASEAFVGAKHKLAIALGKTIGGEPVIVDLARMPHLLVAGTTGSGKSVAINTMILSLLYRLKPEDCRLIMVDPKMLELSIYDGIPHLLTPVVTDPKKAVIALKWAVREMEDRYKKMSKVGVRNIDGFNARVAEAKAKGEVITRTVQTGYDRHTGEAIYEQEAMDLAILPYIVVIVDEMADLMMVAGKDIEGAIQRLAQMARAAGIHLIMATQRPSVDVITGTIKANFPTRISFQVTSKIDSRTILGEQGAEQLLGQGDMLHMIGGGRIARVHGPFVSDQEVELVVAHLKAQGQPDYLDVTTEDGDGGSADPSQADPDAEEGAVFDKTGMGAASGTDDGDLYDQAVKIVLRDKKCSTSYIQRRLSVGYNKAASLVEKMEKEGIVGAANHAGKREILIYSRDVRAITISMPEDDDDA